MIDDKLYMRVKYLEDTVREQAKKILDQEVQINELAEKLAAHTKDTAQSFFRLGEIHALTSSEIGQIKLHIQEINQQLGALLQLTPH